MLKCVHIYILFLKTKSKIISSSSSPLEQREFLGFSDKFNDLPKLIEEGRITLH